jgi:hypothetical protein
MASVYCRVHHQNYSLHLEMEAFVDFLKKSTNAYIFGKSNCNTVFSIQYGNLRIHVLKKTL